MTTAPQAWIHDQLTTLRQRKRLAVRYLLVAALLGGAFTYHKVWSHLSDQQERRADALLKERIHQEDEYMAHLQKQREALATSSRPSSHP